MSKYYTETEMDEQAAKYFFSGYEAGKKDAIAEAQIDGACFCNCKVCREH